MSADRFTLRNLYLYVVCLITLVITIFAGVFLVRNVVALVYPEPKAYYFPDDMRPEQRERQEKLLEESERRGTILSLVTNGTLLLISVPTYVYHWRQVQSARPGRRRTDAPSEGEPAGDGQ